MCVYVYIYSLLSHPLTTKYAPLQESINSSSSSSCHSLLLPPAVCHSPFMFFLSLLLPWRQMFAWIHPNFFLSFFFFKHIWFEFNQRDSDILGTHCHLCMNGTNEWMLTFTLKWVVKLNSKLLYKCRPFTSTGTVKVWWVWNRILCTVQQSAFMKNVRAPCWHWAEFVQTTGDSSAQLSRLCSTKHKVLTECPNARLASKPKEASLRTGFIVRRQLHWRLQGQPETGESNSRVCKLRIYFNK